jgi:hypothetical protein
MPNLTVSGRNLAALAETIIADETDRLGAMATELRNRLNELERVITTGHRPTIVEAIHYLLDAEYELTGDSEAFGFLDDQYGITDVEYERHFEKVEAERKLKGKS